MKKYCMNSHVFRNIKARNSHLKITCRWDVRGKECSRAQSSNPNVRSKHMLHAAHQIDCDDEEWMQRIIVAELVKAHYDGRYR